MIDQLDNDRARVVVRTAVDDERREQVPLVELDPCTVARLQDRRGQVGVRGLAYRGGLSRDRPVWSPG